MLIAILNKSQLAIPTQSAVSCNQGIACAILNKLQMSSGASRWPCGLPRWGKWEAGSFGQV